MKIELEVGDIVSAWDNTGALPEGEAMIGIVVALDENSAFLRWIVAPDDWYFNHKRPHPSDAYIPLSALTRLVHRE